MRVLWVDNASVVELDKLRDITTNQYDNGASVELVAYDSDGVEMPGTTWPKVMENVGEGKYRTTFNPPPSNAIAGETYYAHIDVTASNGVRAHWEIPIEARIRDA